MENLSGNESIESAREALDIAEESEVLIKILKAKQALGIALLNSGQLREAESFFADIITTLRDEQEDAELRQILGTTLVVRTNILLGKSLYNQALEIGLQALGILGRTKDYVGLGAACSVLSRTHRALGNEWEAETYQNRAEVYKQLAKDE